MTTPKIFLRTEYKNTLILGLKKRTSAKMYES